MEADCWPRLGPRSIGSQMFYAIKSCMPLVLGPCGASLDRLRIEFGRECFTKGYTKMYLLSRLCSKVGLATRLATETLFEYCLQGLLFELRYDLLLIGDMTVPRLECTRGGHSGKLGVLLWKYLVTDSLFAVVRQAVKDSAGALKSEADALENDFGSYPAMEKNFQSQADPQDALEAWQQNKRKSIVEASNFLFDLYGCVYDADLAKINIEECKDPTQYEWETQTGMDKFAIAVRLFRSAGTAVSCSAAEDAPIPNNRTLKRLMSDPVYEDARHEEVQRERQDTWRKVTAERKQSVT